MSRFVPLFVVVLLIFGLSDQANADTLFRLGVTASDANAQSYDSKWSPSFQLGLGGGRSSTFLVARVDLADTLFDVATASMHVESGFRDLRFEAGYVQSVDDSGKNGNNLSTPYIGANVGIGVFYVESRFGARDRYRDLSAGFRFRF